MKLSQKTEWIVIAALIAYLAFTPGFQIVKDILATPLGKAAALVGIVYVWKYVSAIIALLLLIGYMRCAKNNIWEMFSGAEQTCMCESSDFIWDSSVKKCKDATGKEGGIKSCTCASGYSWDTMKKECVVSSDVQPPIPPVIEPVPGVPSTAAPAVSTGPVTSSAPMTTPSATQSMVMSTPPSVPPSSGVQPNMSSSNVSPVM
jgi:hypothetical protein